MYTDQEFLNTFIPFRSSVQQTCMIILNDDEEAKDATQDIFLKIWENRSELDEVVYPKAFMIRIAKNYCLDKLRKQKNDTSVRIDDFDIDIPAQAKDAAEHLIAKENLHMVSQWIHDLKEPHRSIIKLTHIEQISNKEVAERLSISEGNVRVILSRLRKEIKTIIGKNY